MQKNDMELTQVANYLPTADGFASRKSNYGTSQGPRIFSSIPNTMQAYQRIHMKNEIVADSYDVHDSFIHKEEQKNSEITTLLQNTEVGHMWSNPSSSKLQTRLTSNSILVDKENVNNRVTSEQVISDAECEVGNPYSSSHRENEAFAFCHMFREKDEAIVWKLSLLSQRRSSPYIPPSFITQRNSKRKKWYSESDLSDIDMDEDSDLYRTIRTSFRVVKDNKKNGRLRSQNSSSNNLHTKNNSLGNKKKAKNDKRSYQQQPNNNELSFVSSGVWFWDTKCRQAVAICLDNDTLTRDISEIFGRTS
ncbi:uncharacterized protein Gasu_45180 [Galdieria sulphuraria]|uniref:Uncharacterized protein n=1 Tax=Galdieria sulphuraria TaxID=130081 RepID=M2WVL7_GALSU|nr:uncharacterized protein Gasu_45180 [Galdieria sulphuraria]EME28020.1 hypothetical protein Gasu_45180 [Galdieria sulphuraria]|eukprot:XP_005704540.1 hypothetical protein Gasu_45180 [Galdieria sulphuraria]